MKVFISWSGEESHKVGLALREWLPSVIQTIEPYVSSEDIDKGTRWSTDIAGELDESAFGILCVTKQNLNAPWLNFEAGALGKSVDKSKVCPLLFRIKRSEVSGPILQFQSTVVEQEDIYKLLKSINSTCGSDAIPEARLEKAFNVWWPSLEEELAKIPTQEAQPPAKKEPENPTEKILEELLQLSRNSQMILRNPEELLPVDYMDHVLRKTGISRNDVGFGHPAIRELLEGVYELDSIIRNLPSEMVTDSPELNRIHTLMRNLRKPMKFVEMRSRRSGEFDF